MNSNTIFITHGTDYKQMAIDILVKADVAADIGGCGQRIALKPNLAVAKDASSGATTHKELLDGVLQYLTDHGFNYIAIMEGSWIGDSTALAFDTAGYRDIAKKYGVPLVDLQKDSYKNYDASGMKIALCDAAAAIDYMINMPVLKGHCQTNITCALKNYKGIIPNNEKRRFHQLGLHRPIAHLAAIVPKGFMLVDNICGDLDFEEGGNPVSMNRVFGTKDPVLCDAFVCESIGYSIEDVPYIGYAADLGLGNADISTAEFVVLNEPSALVQPIHSTRRVAALAKYATPKDACSACYGSLIYALNRLDESGRLGRKKAALGIGQGYRGTTGSIGIGQCTSCFDCYLKGCPPKAKDIVAFLMKNWT